MATSKTLTPTNVTIQIPEFTDQPDQRVNSNCMDKEADAINALNSKMAHVYGDWTPTFPRDTATNITAKYARIGNVMICSAKWTNVHTTGQGASYMQNLPSFSGASRITGFHGVWHAANDIGGECGSNPVSNSFWFEKSGVHTELPDSTIEFVAFGIVQTN